MSEQYDLIKKLQLRSQLRGSKENCELLGSFAKKHLRNLDKKQITEFEKLLDYSDPEITDWLLGHARPPKHLIRIIESVIKLYKWN